MKEKHRTTRLADCLMRLGTSRVEAELVACLLAESPLPTKDILDRTGLRQPEVSVGMRTLRERGWVESEPIPREGKGRPMHRYALLAAPDAVYAFYAEAAQEQIRVAQAALQELAQRLPGKAAHVDTIGARDEGSVAQT